MSRAASASIAGEEVRFPRQPARAETVGSLLRPPALRQAIDGIYTPGHTALLDEERQKDLSRLHHLEDEAIREAVHRQIAAGLDVVTDGEFRRYMFTNSFYDAVAGMEPSTAMITFVDERGDRIQYAGPPMPRERLRTVDNPTVREVSYLRSLTDYPFKVTFPAASWFTFPFWWRPGVTDRAYESHEEMLEHIRPNRDVALLAFGYGPHVWLWGVHYALNLMGIPILTAGGLDTSARGRFIDQYRPTILACTPSYALRLGMVMQEMGLDPACSSVRYLFCAGEPGYSVPATRQRLEALWDAELHEFYGCTEAAPAAGGYTCHAMAAQKNGPAMTHLMEDVQIWEIVDPATLKPLPDGEWGLSVVTNLCSEASPQLRFLVGDFATLTHEPCPCGRTHARAVGGFLGRADDLLNVRGITVFPSSVEDAVRRVPGVSNEFAIVLTQDRNLNVLIVQVEVQPDTPVDRFGEIGGQVEREVRSRCELRPVVEVLPPGTLPPTEFKAKRVRDLRPRP